MTTHERRLSDNFIVSAPSPEVLDENSLARLMDKEIELKQKAIQQRYAGNRPAAEYWSIQADEVSQRIDRAQITSDLRN